MIEKQFTALLRSFVQDTAPKTEEPWNMAELQRAAAQQNMLPVLAYENKRWRLSTDSELNISRCAKCLFQEPRE